MAKKYSPAIAEQVENYLKGIGMDHRPITDDGVITAGIQLKTVLDKVIVAFVVDKYGYVVYGLMPIKVEPDKTAVMSDFIGLVNYNIKYGSFEMDKTDGEVRFRVYNLTANGSVSSEQIDQAFTLVIKMLDDYGQLLLDVMNGKSTPEEAFRTASTT